MENRKTKKQLIWDIAFWVIIGALFVIWTTDFIRVKIDKQPIFCLVRKTVDYDDGNVKTCSGLGYKVITYNRDSMPDRVEYGPFFISIKEK